MNSGLGQYHIMVQRIVPPELIKFDARSYFKAVRKAFHDEPAKYSKFVKLWYHSKTHKLDRASAIAMVKELMKDHPNLILGFYAFLPPEANKGFGQSQTIVGRRRTPDATMDAAFSYAVDLMEAFYAEPEKFDEFTKLLKDIKAHRVDVATGYARVGELLKDHRNLLIGLNAFLPPEAKITIPPKANTTIAPEAKKPTHSDVMDYLKKTKEALHDEPARFEEFIKLLNDRRTRRLSVANTVAKLEELMKDHPNLLLGFYFLFPKSKKTIPSEAEQQAAAKNNKRERALNFVRKLKVAAILRAQGHEELVMELPEFFNVIADWPASTEDSQAQEKTVSALG
ncbi:unnamed protein product [Arabis nemorensis]|uniref:Uncharacterized protein n=1 Tax=Arabis nemorensis TaxID=586526 RepID=A0A565B071_9BRAS|nr:unnamed protein product [Arabis nemorensis]